MQRFLAKHHRLVIPALLILTSSLFGQLKSDLPLTASSPRLKSVASPSWFNPQRFSMSHGFSISLLSGTGLARGATSLSVYTNQMRYMFANNLILNSQIYLVQPGLMSASQLGGNNLQIYYQAGMDWQPFNSMRIHLGVSNLPPLWYYPPWYRPMPTQFQGHQAPDHSDSMEP